MQLFGMEPGHVEPNYDLMLTYSTTEIWQISFQTSRKYQPESLSDLIVADLAGSVLETAFSTFGYRLQT